MIFGGSGYIGRMLAQHFVAARRFDEIVLADIRPPEATLPPGVRYLACDVRHPVPPDITAERADWIFNLAAVHREPGHADAEYFDTNLPGAHSVCDYAAATGCPNVVFSSSIAVYGPMCGATDEDHLPRPNTAYGVSKLCAELIHETWQAASPERRLIVVRPGVVYGPGDPGNILRMIHAVRRGYFFFPGPRQIRKSYAYIYGLLESLDFTMDRREPRLIYNYVEEETETIGDLVRLVRRHLGSRTATFSVPAWLLARTAEAAQWLTNGRSPLHPVRVRKAATATHIVPARLKQLGFTFRYDFPRSLRDWSDRAPGDFA